MSAVFKHSAHLLHTYLDCKTDLFGFLSRRTGSACLAADLVHDLYFKLRQVKDVTSITNNRAYLFTMAANLATDHERVENRRRMILNEGGEAVWPTANDLGPECQALIDAELHFVIEEVAKLNKRPQEVFYLSRYQGKTQADIAAELGISITTVFKDLKVVMSRVAQARQRFAGNE